MSLPLFTLRHFLLGSTGAGLGYALLPELSKATGEDPDDAKTIGAAGGGLIGLSAATAPYAAQKWIGKNIDNFSEGAYNIKDLKPESFAEKIAFNKNGNMGLSLYRNTMGALRGEPYKKLMDTVKSTYGVDADPMEKWISYKKGKPTATYEEFRLKILDDLNQKNNNILKNTIKSLEDESKRFKPNDNEWQVLKSKINELKRRQINLEVSSNNRLYRHEIAKNEIQNMTWGDKWSSKRLKQAGYNYEGMYKWGDVKSFINSSASKAWEEDADKYVKDIKKSLNITKPWALNTDKKVHVVRNIHRGDRVIPIKLGKKYLRLGREISYRIASGQITNEAQLNKFILDNFRYHSQFFKPSARDLSSISKKYSTRYGKNITRKMALGLWRKDTAKNLIGQIVKSGAFKKASLGAFELPGLGGVSTLYLEGGINTNAKFTPYLNKRANRIEIATRIIKTDIQDAPFSVQTRTQRNPVVIVDEYLERFNPRAIKVKGNLKQGVLFDDMIIRPESLKGTDVMGGKKMYGSKGVDYPIGQDSWDELKSKKLKRGEAREILKSPELKIKDKISKVSKVIKKSPFKKTVSYALSRAPSMALKSSGLIGTGLLAYTIGADMLNAMSKND